MKIKAAHLKLKKVRLFFVLTLLLVCLVAGAFIFNCSRIEKEQSRLSFLFVPAMDDPFYHTIELGLRLEADKSNVELHVSDYPYIWDAELQVEILNKSVKQYKPDLIIIAPASPLLLIDPLKAHYQKGIAVITIDTYLGNGDYRESSPYNFPLCFIGTDNVQGGREVAEHLSDLLNGQGKVYCIGPNEGVTTINDRITGFTDGLSRFPDIELMGVDYCEDSETVAYNLTIEKLKENPDIRGIFAINVISAQGVAQAIADTGLTGAVKITSWDASKKLIDALYNNQVDFLLAQKPKEMGTKAVEWGVRHLVDGDTVPKKVISGFVFFTPKNIHKPEIQQYIYNH